MRKHFGNGLVARLGGEEFAIVLSGLDEDQLYNRLDDFRRAISVAQIAFEQEQINFSVSLGVIFNSDELLAKQMSLADSALYYAKENGRNQVSIVGALEES
jgi:diguanylate cyclase (GGDEF)-like protein